MDLKPCVRNMIPTIDLGAPRSEAEVRNTIDPNINALHGHAPTACACSHFSQRSSVHVRQNNKFQNATHCHSVSDRLALEQSHACCAQTSLVSCSWPVMCGWHARRRASSSSLATAFQRPSWMLHSRHLARSSLCPSRQVCCYVIPSCTSP